MNFEMPAGNYALEFKTINGCNRLSGESDVIADVQIKTFRRTYQILHPVLPGLYNNSYHRIFITLRD
jgi:hypothetical protein